MAKTVPGFSLLTLIALHAATGLLTAADRHATVQALEAIPAAWSAAGLQIRLDEERPAAGHERNRVAIGEPRRLFLRAAEKLYMTAIQIDSDGVLTLLYPAPGAAPEPTAELLLTHTPATPDGAVGLPMGPQDVLVFGTQQPLAAERLADSPVIAPEQSQAFVQRLRDSLRASGEQVARAHLALQVEGRPKTRSLDSADYTADDIVRFFSNPATRGFRKAPSPIHFDVNQAVLAPDAVSQLDQYALALRKPELSGLKLVIEGHADLQGAASYNMELSRRRAESARRYLLEQGIPEQRLETRAFGESAPLLPGESAESNRQNRRVEFRMSLGG